MSTLHGRSRVGPDGTLRITLPPDHANSDIEYVLEVHAAGTNGAAPALSRRKRSGEARRESLRRLAGSVDDPTFQRPPQGTAEPLEPLD